MSPTRRLIWLLSALLTLSALQAAPAVRTTPFAQVRGAACLVLAEILGEEASVREDRERPVYPESQELPALADAPRNRAWRTSLFRFQLPPPSPGDMRLSLVA